MRINLETLQKLARDQVTQRVKNDYDVLAVYLHGSLLGNDPLIAGTGDIDLVFIYSQPVVERREIVRITDDIHLDITHARRDLYRQPKEMRLNPWMGPVVYGCKILHDPQHFMDFVQASVRGQFDRPDNVMERARKQLEHARQIWLGLQSEAMETGPKQVLNYLKGIDHAANAIASLYGPPLAERRFLPRFVECANLVGQPTLVGSLLNLLGGPNSSPEMLQRMLPNWAADLKASPEDSTPARLQPVRLHYYARALEAYLAPGQPYQAALWPLLRTWTELAALQKESSAASWKAAADQLGLVGEAFSQRLEEMDTCLDEIDETLEGWSRKFGA